MTPATGEHQTHGEQGIGCGNCHPGYASGTTINWTLHVNNAKDVGPFLNESGQPLASGRYSNGNCTNVCHGTETW
jgi:hypothetical protein